MTTHPQGGVVDKRRILLLGATGYTGQRVLRELLARGEAPTLVGRNRTKMLALADRLEADLPVAEVEFTSTADLRGSWSQATWSSPRSARSCSSGWRRSRPRRRRARTTSTPPGRDPSSGASLSWT